MSIRGCRGRRHGLGPDRRLRREEGVHRRPIAQAHGFAVAGGSDIALSCDLVVMAEDARIGYMPARIWGCPTTAMRVYRLGAERAKRMLLTGDTIDGIARHSPEGRWFQEFAATHGFHEAVAWHDSGRWIPEGGGPVPTAEDLEG
ncbi:enoyl-CoA hydratase-related protein [Actinomadura parmotrematis]|uniref:enoyl-CoA hydratase-related protein n=1 Tax=Actinomadura parmotrematis TaxID=2864039 RepID=UPI0027E331D4|nr:enoyl-CoA hydratase-related protein [Actinomadura parmotrematis]